jgi:hypothetical protein
MQVQDIFVERSLEANSLSEDFKMHVSNHNHRSCQREDRIFEYKTVFVDGEVQDGTGPGVSFQKAPGRDFNTFAPSTPHRPGFRQIVGRKTPTNCTSLVG